jgi:hypothetical protein
VFAEITENTLQAIPGLTDPSQDGYHDTSTEADPADTALMGDLSNTNRWSRESRSLNSGRGCQCPERWR